MVVDIHVRVFVHRHFVLRLENGSICQPTRHIQCPSEGAEQAVDPESDFAGKYQEIWNSKNRGICVYPLFQATFPLLLQLIGLLMLLNWSWQIISVETCFYAFIILHWLPVLNPMASILTNRPYRDAVIRKLRLCTSRGTSSVTPITANDVINA
jgi:hypothetical protein